MVAKINPKKYATRKDVVRLENRVEKLFIKMRKENDKDKKLILKLFKKLGK